MSERSQNGSRSSGIPPGVMKLVVLCLACVVTFVLVEVGLRLVWHNPFANEQPDRLLKLRIQHPGTDHWISRGILYPDDAWGRLRADGDAYIRPSVRFSDPDATVVFLGGSTTANVAVREESRFHHVVSLELEKAGLRVNALNGARSGNTLQDSLNVFLNHVAPETPDVAVVMHATNDIGVLGRDPTYRTRRGSVVRMRDLAGWAIQIASAPLYSVGLLRNVITSGGRLETDSIRALAKNDPSAERLEVDAFARRVRSFVGLSRAFGVHPVLMTQPLAESRFASTPEWADRGNQDRLNALIRSVAADEVASLIDLDRYLQESRPDRNEPMAIFYDGMHFSDAGSEYAGRFIAGRLREILDSIRSESNRSRSVEARPETS